MKLYLDRRIVLDGSDQGLAEVVTEKRSWTKGWLAQLIDGKRIFLREFDADLSRAGFGKRRFRLVDEGRYEAESVCASLRKHRVRFDLSPRGVIILRSCPTDAQRCHHLRSSAFVSDAPQSPAGLLALLKSVVSSHEPQEAAVFLGMHLEQHLQRMCEDRGLDTRIYDRSKGIDALSAALKKHGVYPKEVHRDIIQMANVRKRVQHDGELIAEEEVHAAVIAFCDFQQRYPATVPLANSLHPSK